MPKILVARRGLALVPVTPYATREIEKIAEGDDVLVTIRRARSARQNRFYHAFMDKVAEGLGYDSPETLKQQVKEALGYFDWIQTFDGRRLMVLRSTSEDDMGPEEFNEFLTKVIDYLCREHLPHMTSKHLRHEIGGMLAIKHY